MQITLWVLIISMDEYGINLARYRIDAHYIVCRTLSQQYLSLGCGDNRLFLPRSSAAGFCAGDYRKMLHVGTHVYSYGVSNTIQ